MMRSAVISLIALLVAAAIVLLAASAYTIPETEQAIITQFGRPVGQPVTQAGLHFKSPFVQQVHRLEKRILEWDGEPNQVPTRDKLFIHVDTFARWRINNPMLYFQRIRSEEDAHSRLDDILDGETRNAVGMYDLIELVRTENRQPTTQPDVGSAVSGRLQTIQAGRQQIASIIHKRAAARLADLGIELLDIRFKRINYNPDVQARIYERMISERRQMADKFLSEGQGEAARIQGEKERELKLIGSKAYRQTQEIQGKADAQATDIYARAFNQSPAAYEFYQFLRTMETYRTTLDSSTTVILSTDSDYFRFLQGAEPRPPAPAERQAQ